MLRVVALLTYKAGANMKSDMPQIPQYSPWIGSCRQANRARLKQSWGGHENGKQ